MIEAGLSQLITQSAEFSNQAGARLNPVLLPEDSPLPAATYQRITTNELYTLEERIGVSQVRIQFDTWASVYGDAKSLMQAIADVLDNYAGTLPNGTRILGTQLVNCKDLYHASARIYHVSTDYFFQYIG